MQPNEIIREYLLSELIEEEKLREYNRKLVNNAVKEEEQRVLAEIDQDPNIEEIRRNHLHQFWEETRKIYGEDALVEMRSPNVINAVKNLEENLERVLQCTILECMECEMELAAQLQVSSERENTGNFNNQEEEEEEVEEFNENIAEEEYKPREATSEVAQSENQSVEHYRTSEQHEISEHQSRIHEDEQEGEEEYEYEQQDEPISRYERPSQALEEEGRPVHENSHSPERRTRTTHLPFPVTPPGQYFYPRYINQREKMEMLIKQPIYVQTQGEVTSPISEKKIQEYQFNKKIQGANFTLEPHSNIPEEKGLKVTDEQPFIEDFDMDVPRKLKVSMASVAPDLDEAGYPEPWYNKNKSEGNKTATLNKSTISKNYPLENIYDEKSFIKKNIDNYQTFEPEDANFFAQNVFSDLDVKKGYENDVILERLKQRYEAAYRENFLLDRAEMRHTEKNKRRPVNLPDTEFLSDEQIRGSKLLSTLKSPENASGLKQLDEQSLSESFQEYKALNSGRKIPHSAKVEYLEAYRASRGKSRERTSPEKKRIPIFEQFEREIFELASSEVRNLYPGLSHANEISSASTHKSYFFSRPRKTQDIGMVEDFILDLYRTVSTNNGAVPPKYQHKLQEILKLKPTTNKYYEGKRGAKDTTERGENGDDQTSELNLIKDSLVITGQEITNRAIDALKPNPENKMRTLLWKCMMAIQANFDKTIDLVNQHVVGKYEKVVQYVSQPGKVLLQIRTLSKKLRKEEIKKTLYDDFFNFFGDVEDELIKGNLDDGNEKLLLKYIYLTKRLIEALEREEKLSVINNAEQRIITNQKMNQKYLENKERRRVDTGEARSPNYLISHPNQEMYGINFAKWEESLKAIEKENKLLVKYGEEKKRKEEKSKKLEEKKKLKEEELKEYEEYSLRSQVEKQQKEEIKRQEIEFKRNAIAERISALKQQKQLVKSVQKGQLEENIKKTIEDIQYKNQLKEKTKEEIKEVQKERKAKLEELKKQKLDEKQVTGKSEKEEYAWKKAQELFEKQKRLLQERDRLSQQLKNSAK